MEMDISWLSRTSLLIGEERLRLLTQKHVMVVGLGGVGSLQLSSLQEAGLVK
jgi:tRNA A37 threonylcarbamoyladenosine dehydratase